MDGWMDGWMDEWMDGWMMTGWMIGWLVGSGSTSAVKLPRACAQIHADTHTFMAMYIYGGSRPAGVWVRAGARYKGEDRDKARVGVAVTDEGLSHTPLL
jgi:hypothetical protein